MTELVAFCDPDSLESEYLATVLAERRVPQNLFYLLDGAGSFYTYRSEDLMQIAWQDEYQFFVRHQASFRGRQAFISLGCGNSGPEKPLLHQMAAEGGDFAYFGIDSSEAMLRLAAENLADASFTRTFVLADFTHPDFADQLARLVADFDTRIYAMIGATFGNFDQVWLAGLLKRLVPAGDYLYLDIVPMYGSDEKDRWLKERFSQLPENLRLFFDRLLSALRLSREYGEVVGVEQADDHLDTICYTFFFRATQTTTLSCLGEEMTLSPGDQIELLSIRAYDIPSLEGFMAQHGFRLVDTYIPDVGNLSHLWQRLLFVKEIAASGM